MAENIFLKVMEYNPKIKINFVRLGLIYGLEDCPIRKILFFRRYYIELYPGKPESFFAVTDPADLAKYLLDTTSIIWNSSQTYSNFYEEKNINLKYIHQKYNYYIPSKKSVFKYLIDENNLLIKIANLFGKNIDLSLSSVDRFPKNQTIVDYQPTKGFDLYLKAIFKI